MIYALNQTEWKFHSNNAEYVNCVRGGGRSWKYSRFSDRDHQFVWEYNIGVYFYDWKLWYILIKTVFDLNSNTWKILN